jgi:uncharacterized protein (DUF983 family)
MKETIFYSILHQKCPRCHTGEFFKTRNPYNLKEFDKLHTSCAVCNEDFEREAGFYYGAMYVSYGLTVAFGVAMYILVALILGYDEITYLITFGIFQVLLMPIFFRLSRIVWINFFVKYKKQDKA